MALFRLVWPAPKRLSISRFYADRWQPVQCEYADRVEQEHLQRFLSHKMADYVWDAQTSTRLEKQVSQSVGEGSLNSL